MLVYINGVIFNLILLVLVYNDAVQDIFFLWLSEQKIVCGFSVLYGRCVPAPCQLFK